VRLAGPLVGHGGLLTVLIHAGRHLELLAPRILLLLALRLHHVHLLVIELLLRVLSLVRRGWRHLVHVLLVRGGLLVVLLGGLRVLVLHVGLVLLLASGVGLFGLGQLGHLIR